MSDTNLPEWAHMTFEAAEERIRELEAHLKAMTQDRNIRARINEKLEAERDALKAEVEAQQRRVTDAQAVRDHYAELWENNAPLFPSRMDKVDAGSIGLNMLYEKLRNTPEGDRRKGERRQGKERLHDLGNGKRAFEFWSFGEDTLLAEGNDRRRPDSDRRNRRKERRQHEPCYLNLEQGDPDTIQVELPDGSVVGQRRQGPADRRGASLPEAIRPPAAWERNLLRRIEEKRQASAEYKLRGVEQQLQQSQEREKALRAALEDLLNNYSCSCHATPICPRCEVSVELTRKALEGK